MLKLQTFTLAVKKVSQKLSLGAQERDFFIGGKI
jgi:hypothetical protein